MILLNQLLVLALIGISSAIPTTTSEFYDALHKRLTSKSNATKDACQVIANKEVFSYEEAINCYKSFPLAESVRRETIDTLNKTLEFYVFKDIAGKFPNDNSSSSIDIDSEMETISKYKFHTEFEFNSFLTGFFNTLHDGHTRYSSECYSRFTFQQPFALFMQDFQFWIYPNAKHSDSLVAEWQKLGVDIRKLQGSQVLKINDMEPMKYMERYSHFYIGMSRDLSSRISVGLARTYIRGRNFHPSLGSFSFSSLVPLNSFVKYSLETLEGEKIEVEAPYLVESPKGFSDSTSFYSEYCQPDVTNNETLEQTEKEEQVVMNTPNNELVNKSQVYRRDEDSVEEIYFGSVLMAYKLGHGTGVLIIPHFIVYNDEIWYSEIQKVFEAFHKHGIKKLILELSNNTGGLVYRGNDILQSLFPNTTQFSFDMRSSELLRDLSLSKTDNAFSPRNYTNTNEFKFSDENAFMIQKPHPRGSHKMANFTPKFKEYLTPNSYKPPVTFEPKNIAIVTNLICYAACAQLVSSLQLQYNVSAYTVGLNTQHQTLASSMAGGSYMTLDQLISILDDTKLLSHPRAPRPLPSHASFSFNLMEAYANESDNIPLEFKSIPADYHINYEHRDLINPLDIWLRIAGQMNGTPASEPETIAKDNSNEGLRGNEI